MVTSPKALKSGDWINTPLHDDTKFVHAGVVPDLLSGAILNPIVLSTTFVQESVEKYLDKGFSYSRSGNPTVTAFEERMAAVENGVGAAAFGTGMLFYVFFLYIYRHGGH